MGNEEVIPAVEKEANPLSILDRAEKAVKEINEGISKLEKLKSDNDAVAARIALSGRAEAGTVIKPKPALTNIEIANKFFAGENPFKDENG